MEFFVNPYAIILIFSGLVVGIISGYIGMRFKDPMRWIGLTMFSAAFWGFFYGIELTGKSLEELLFWIKIEYLGLLAAPVCWVIFSLKYTGIKPGYVRQIGIALFVFQLVTYLFILTNSFHGLHYKSNWLIESGPFPILGIEKGPWYKVQTIFSYSCFLAGTLLLWRRFNFSNSHFKYLTRFIIAGGFFPLFINVLYQLGVVKPFDGLDLTPFAFLFTYFFIGIAIVKYQFLDLKPVARDKILEMVTRGVMVFDQKMKLVDYNPTAQKICGKIENFGIGISAEQLFSDRPEILNFLNDSTLQKTEIKFSEGEKITHLKVESVPLTNKNELISGYILLFEDISNELETKEKLKQQALELQQLNDLKDKFFGIISHDLKGPIFGVKELIHLTQSGLISHEEFLEILPEVSKNMEQVANLLENLLAWTSSQLRGEHIEKKELELTTILRNQKNLLTRIAKEKNINIELENLEETWVEADKNMLELIIRNLISNAIKFSAPGQNVEISLSKNLNEVTICVRDYGMGIEEENLKKLNAGISFTTRGQNNEGGTGLGLVLVREYIQKNGGTLTISSQAGEGSKFCFSLPLLVVESSES